MLQDSTPTSISSRVYLGTFTNDERKRRESALRNKDFFYGRQEQYLSILNSDVDPITINMVNPIVTKKSSLLYNRPLVRVFDGPSTSVSYLEGLYSQIKIDTILKKADLCAELTGTSLVYVGMYEDGSIYLIVYDASDFTPISNDVENKVLEAVSLVTIRNDFIDKGGNIEVQRILDTEIWTNNYIYNYVGSLEKQSSPNELGYIPFVAFKGQEVNNQYLGHSPTTSLRQLNHYLNQTLTNLGYMIKMQSATPIVLTGFSNGEAVSVHPGTAISLPAGSTAEALNLSPKIMETMELIKYLEEKTYETSCVPKISIVGNMGAASSGVELMIKWAPLISVFKEKSVRFQNYEFELANMILSVAGLDAIDDVKVLYPEENLLPIDPSRELLETDIKLGIRTPVDEVIKLNPNLTESDAEAEVLANIGFNNQFNGGSGVRTNE
jgi:hypothetical protein